MAKPNYEFEKRQRDLAKKKKQEEKRQKKHETQQQIHQSDLPATPTKEVSDAQ